MKLNGITTSFKCLDDAIGGWQNSDFILIVGEANIGKSSFAISVAKRLSVDQNIPVAYFSLRMNREQLVTRLISNACDIESSKIRDCQLKDDEKMSVQTYIKILDDSPLFIDDNPDLSLNEFEAKVRNLSSNKGIKLVIVDYLSLMTTEPVVFHDRKEELVYIANTIKKIAEEINIPIILLSHFRHITSSPLEMGYDSIRSHVSDLRLYFGPIDEKADVVAFIHRPEYHNIFKAPNGCDLRNKVEIIIAKNHQQEPNIVLMNFCGKYSKMQDLDTGLL